MIRLHEIKLKTDEPLDKLIIKAERKLKLPGGSLFALRIVKESLDAREKPVIYRVFSIDVESELSDEVILKAAGKAGVKANRVRNEKYVFPKINRLPVKRPVVVGFGPCGMFAALSLAIYGLKPIVLERGPAMDERIEAVEAFWKTGILNPNANVQFGEGGAGTFSDGKLTTGTRDAAQRFVLESFVDAGAQVDILYKQHPHIGSDVLRTVVVNIRKKIESLGGDVLFNAKLDCINIDDGKVVSVGYNGKTIETNDVILALGHSARDSMEYLYEKGIQMSQKPFSMGVRIEHKQNDIDMSEYGCGRREAGLPAAEYKLFTKTSAGRGVYSFCMCPGGYVVASASKEGYLVTNGMSNADRGAENANSAILCDVGPEDFGSDHPLAGMYFQEKYERLAFEAGGSDYKAPAETLGSFMGMAETEPCVNPTYMPGVKYTRLEACLPEFVTESLREAIPDLGRKMKGFDNPGAVMTGIESRSSSPVRIARNDNKQAVGTNGCVITGLYPGGEGAGYAGGIMSAACDGVHLAEQIVR